MNKGDPKNEKNNMEKSIFGSICIDIYFSRKKENFNNNSKVLIEKWNINIDNLMNDKGGGSNINNSMTVSSRGNYFNPSSLNNDINSSNKNQTIIKKFRKTFTKKRMINFIRTIYSYTRNLPAFTLFTKKGFDYNLEYKFYHGNQNLSSYLFYDNFLKVRKKIKNDCDVGVGVIRLEVEYLLKNDIFQFEQEIKILNQRLGIEKSRHQRVSSSKFLLIEEKECTNNLNDSDLELKRVNSRSVDKKQINNIKLGNLSDSECSSNKSYEKLEIENDLIEIDKNDHQLKKLEIYSGNYLAYNMYKEKRELSKIINKLKFDTLENNEVNLNSPCRHLKGKSFSLDSDSMCLAFEEEKEEILEISEQSLSQSNIYLLNTQDIEDINFNKEDIKSDKLIANISEVIYKLAVLKKQLLTNSKINFNILNLYKFVNKT